MKPDHFVLGDLEETIAPSDIGDPMIAIPVLIVFLIFLPGALAIRPFSAA
jgi:hypothetical protein